jgi:pSer/pThr/pTyr-binding forkhead associated (FHA) protein
LAGERPEVLLEDQNSKYGTFLNGAILNPKTSLKDLKRYDSVKYLPVFLLVLLAHMARC